MKSFWKTVLAVVVGTFIVGILGFLLMLSVLGSIGSSPTPVMPRSGVLRIDMSDFTLAERTTDAASLSLAGLSGGVTPGIGIRQAVNAIDKAAADPAVKYIFLKPDGASAGMSQLEEFRAALEDFRSSGKAVVAYTEMPTTASIYMGSVADRFFMLSNCGAESMFQGIGGRLVFLKDLLDRLGVNVQLIRHGKYKSAGEMYVRSEASGENIEQNQEMISSIWDSYAAQIAGHREVSEEDINKALNNLTLSTPQSFIDVGLIDEALTQEEMKQKIADFAVAEDYASTEMIQFRDYVTLNSVENYRAKQKIAIIYAEGNIVEGDAGAQNIGGEAYASMIAKVRADSTIKAVVFRVDSPGGSVLASDKIRTEIDLLREVKPVIASYGDYAASGGYWISSGCDKIYADATTLTGSIGVFSMIPDLSRTAKDIAHVNVSFVTSHSHSDMYSGLRPLSDAEKAYMQGSVERIYDSFVRVVSEGRGLDRAFVDSVAQGRVWTGADAVRLGLVDEIGTLQDALRYAALSANSSSDPDLSLWQVVEYPAAPSMMEMLLFSFGSAQKDYNVLSGTPLEPAADALLSWRDNYLGTEKGTMFAVMPWRLEVR